MRLSAPICSGITLVVIAACGGDASSGLRDTTCRADADCPATYRCSASACVPLGAGSGGGGSLGGATSAGGSPAASGGGPSAGGLGSGGLGEGGLFASGGSLSMGGGAGSGGASDAGSGGIPIDAAPPPADARPESGGTPTGEGVGCGTSSCALGQRCCSTPGDYACSTDDCADDETSVVCDGPEDCPASEQCCRLTGTSGRVGFACRDNCPAAEIDCGGPQNCPTDTICCETTSSQGSVPERTECAETCTDSEEWILCLVDADCPPDLPTCIPSDLLPGFRRCQ